LRIARKIAFYKENKITVFSVSFENLTTRSLRNVMHLKISSNLWRLLRLKEVQKKYGTSRI